jgi:hypothetical protein
MDGKIQRRGMMPFFIGFSSVFLIALISLRVTDGGHRSLIEDIYRSVGLFTGNGSWAFDPAVAPPRPPVIFKLLAIVAPFVSVLGLAELVTGRAWSDCLRFKAAVLVQIGSKQPTAIFGLTSDSVTFARSMLTVDGRDLPVIFDPEPSLVLMNVCDHEGIPVFTLLPKQSGYLWPHSSFPSLRTVGAFLLLRARHHVSFLADADDQVSLTQALDVWLHGRNVMRKDIWLLMSQRGLRQRLDSYLKFSHRTLRLRFFDFYSLAARQLLHKHRLDMWADVLGQDQIHLAIYGFGNLGRAIAKEAARYYVTRASIQGESPKLRLTIIDTAPEAAKAAFLAEEPEIEKILDIHERTARLQTGGLTSEQLRSVVPAHVTAHIITLNAPEWMVAQALSLRRWLLEPPRDVDQSWFDTHRNAPIFVPVEDWSGLGSLVRSGLDWPGGQARKIEAPDAIFGFGNTDGLLDHASILAEERSEGAKVLHDVYEAHMRSNNQARPGVTPWADLLPNFRLSNLLGFDHIWVKARAAGYRIIPTHVVDTPPFWAKPRGTRRRTTPPQAAVTPPGPVFSDAEKLFLSELEHQRYRAERVSEGWRQAATRCDEIRVHPDLRDWEELGVAEKDIDKALIEAMPAALLAVHKRFVQAHVVGIVGHRLPDARDTDRTHAAGLRMDEAHVRASLRAALSDILRQAPGAVLLTALATGADSWAVEEAKALGIPWVVVLPLPYELYGDDFSAAAEGDWPRRPGAHSWDETFRRLAAEAEYYFELPLVAGRCSEMSRDREKPVTAAARQRREAQYALAGRYIVERSDTLLAVWDGEPARGPGGTGDLVALRSELSRMPPDPPSRNLSKFFPRPVMTEPVVLSAKAPAPVAVTSHDHPETEAPLASASEPR